MVGLFTPFCLMKRSNFKAFIFYLKNNKKILVQIDLTKAFNNVLTQHTQLVDSNGNATLTRHYCDLYIDRILKNIDATHVVYSPSQKCFLLIGKDSQFDQMLPENYLNYTELLALSDIIGVVGTKYMLEQVNTLIYENLIKIKAIVSQNKEVLQSLRINFDRPDMMKDLYRRLESKLISFFFY
jgi:NCK-associated protein 1